MTEYRIIKRHLILLSSLIASSFLLSGIVFYCFETRNSTIHSISDFLWWWVVTTSTVGYGDAVPVTNTGRIVAVYPLS